jgi:hypothetical protein
LDRDRSARPQHKEGPFHLERERKEMCFSWECKWRSKKEHGEDKVERLLWICSGALGGLTARHIVPGGQTGRPRQSDRQLLMLLKKGSVLSA